MFGNARAIIRDTRNLIHQAKAAKANDGHIDEQEAAGLCEESLRLVRDIIGEVKLGPDERALLLGLSDTIRTHLAPPAK